jgi:hypothetical protein
VIAFRKCLTVIINILWFNHSINVLQLAGIVFVFAAVFLEVVSNYLEKLRNQPEIELDTPKFKKISSVETFESDTGANKNDEVNYIIQMIDE